MIPTPGLFRNRWSALIWAGGIIWMAVDVAQSNSRPADAGAVTDPAGEVVSEADLNTIATTLGL